MFCVGRTDTSVDEEVAKTLREADVCTCAVTGEKTLRRVGRNAAGTIVLRKLLHEELPTASAVLLLVTRDSDPVSRFDPIHIPAEEVGLLIALIQELNAIRPAGSTASQRVAMMNRVVDANSDEGAHADYGEDDPGSLGVTDVSDVCPGSSGCCETKSTKQKDGQYGLA
jgi:hypothetical protein